MFVKRKKKRTGKKVKKEKPPITFNPKTNALIEKEKSVVHTAEWVKEQREAIKKFNKKVKPAKKRKLRKVKTRERKIKFENYRTFLHSEYWKRIRNKVLKRDEYTCRKCGSTYNLQVHHKTYENHGAEHKHLNDLITLCNFCHTLEHQADKELNERYNQIMNDDKY